MLVPALESVFLAQAVHDHPGQCSATSCIYKTVKGCQVKDRVTIETMLQAMLMRPICDIYTGKVQLCQVLKGASMPPLRW